MTTRTESLQPVAATKPTVTPALLDLFDFKTQTAESEWTPMTEERRAELIERLIAWSRDPGALDWDYVNSSD